MAAMDPETGQPLCVRLMHVRKGRAEALATLDGAGRLVVGRTSGDVRFTGDVLMSPEHAAIVSEPSSVRVVDLGGGNGVYLKVKEAPLEVGDTFMCASEVLRFAGVFKSEDSTPIADGTVPHGTALPEAGSLVIQQMLFGGRAGASWVRKPPVAIGRETGSITFPRDAFVSSRHAVIERSDSGCVIRDLGSANGTYVKVRGSGQLKNHDTLLVGQQMLVVEIDG
ncbi:MAG: FHA domain-containing protein [Myxococcota bacterium]|jgi:pSer/pThr/pTyr-binding forkhead associated (FHA) protein